eukprot:SM000004S14985  [mRNA]  locus=s4:583314:591791:+ [translate_table: standard]
MDLARPRGCSGGPACSSRDSSYPLPRRYRYVGVRVVKSTLCRLAQAVAYSSTNSRSTGPIAKAAYLPAAAFPGSLGVSNAKRTRVDSSPWPCPTIALHAVLVAVGSKLRALPTSRDKQSTLADEDDEDELLTELEVGGGSWLRRTAGELITDSEPETSSDSEHSDGTGTLNGSFPWVPTSTYASESLQLGAKEPQYQVLEINGTGRITKKDVTRRQLLKSSGLGQRDLRRIDPSLWMTNSSPALLVRDSAILLNLGSLRALVMHDRVLVFDHTSVGARMFLEALQHRLRPDSDGIAIPFEFEVIEAALISRTQRLERALCDVEPKVLNLLEVLPNKLTADALEELRTSKQALVELGAKAGALRQMLLEILEHDGDLKRMTAIGHQCVVNRDGVLECSNINDRDLAEESEQEVEMLFEYYLQKCESFNGQAEKLLDSAKEMEDSIGISLSPDKGEGCSMSMIITMALCGQAFVALLQLAFWATTGGIVVASVEYLACAGCETGNVCAVILDSQIVQLAQNVELASVKRPAHAIGAGDPTTAPATPAAAAVTGAASLLAPIAQQQWLHACNGHNAHVPCEYRQQALAAFDELGFKEPWVERLDVVQEGSHALTSTADYKQQATCSEREPGPGPRVGSCCHLSVPTSSRYTHICLGDGVEPSLPLPPPPLPIPAGNGGTGDGPYLDVISTKHEDGGAALLGRDERGCVAEARRWRAAIQELHGRPPEAHCARVCRHTMPTNSQGRMSAPISQTLAIAPCQEPAHSDDGDGGNCKLGDWRGLARSPTKDEDVNEGAALARKAANDDLEAADGSQRVASARHRVEQRHRALSQCQVTRNFGISCNHLHCHPLVHPTVTSLGIF